MIADLTPRRSVTALRFLYPLWAVVGFFSIVIVTSNVVVSSDAAATVNNILEHEFMFRAAIVGSLFTQLIQILVVLLLYTLLKPVNKNHAVLMVAFAFVGVPIAMLNALNQVAALLAARGADYLSVLGTDQLHTMSMFYVDLNEQGILIAQIFWGLWLLPLGYLVYKSGYFPRVLGIFLAISGFGYLLDTFTRLILPDYGSYEGVLSTVVTVLTIGEVLFMLWVVFMGAKLPEPETS